MHAVTEDCHCASVLHSARVQINAQSLSPNVHVDQSVPILVGSLHHTAEADSHPELHV